MSKSNERLSKEESFWYRFVIIITCSLIVTIGTLYVLRYLLKLGNWGDYLAGAIAGGLWGYVWQMYIEGPGKKWYTLTPLRYITMFVSSIIGLIIIVIAILYLISH